MYHKNNSANVANFQPLNCMIIREFLLPGYTTNTYDLYLYVFTSIGIFYFIAFRQIRIVKKVFCLIVLVTTGCYNFKDHSGQTITGDLLKKPLLIDTSLIRQTGLHMPQAVRRFYASRNFSLFWTDSTGRVLAFDSMLYFLRNAELHGLVPDDYHIQELEKLLKDSTEVDRTDLLLSDAYLTLRHHIKHGRLDAKTFLRMDISSTVDESAITSLELLHKNPIGRELSEVQPLAKQYHLLKRELGTMSMVSVKDSIHVQRSQALMLNMERWRWEKTLPGRYVSVNIPAFLLRVIESDSVWLRSKVIVGKRKTPTPVMESVITSFIIYPYWHVPYSISTKEILPALQKDSSYLKKHNFEVLNKQGDLLDPATISWKLYDENVFPFVLRQREGYENSMGIIKFNFANKYGVYLHDTNSRKMYSRKDRDLSHGCVRVHQAVDFAHYLVREDDIYVSPEDLDQYLSLQQRLKIELRKPIPLRLQYFTCEVDQSGLHYYNDIYKMDSVMIQSLYRSPVVDDQTVVNPL
jgi:murein L,D-transpeptidase YcbB/YkuD